MLRDECFYNTGGQVCLRAILSEGNATNQGAVLYSERKLPRETTKRKQGEKVARQKVKHRYGRKRVIAWTARATEGKEGVVLRQDFELNSGR